MFTTHKSKESKQFTWADGVMEPKEVTIPSINFVLHYGSPCVWEGIRSYKDDKGNTNIVDLVGHVKRLFDSAIIVGMKIPYTEAEVITACKEVVNKNGGGDLYIRPVAFATKRAMSVSPAGSKISLHIYAFKIPPLSGAEKGRKVGFSSHTRGYPQFQMQAKATMNYAHLQLCQNELDSRGLDDVLLMDNQGYITEGLVTNLFIVKGSFILTPPNDGSILPGITRKSVYNIFQSVEFKKLLLRDVHAAQMPNMILEKRLTKADILTADEVFACGTYSEVVPIVEVEGRTIGDGSPGRFTSLIKKAYQDSVRGRVKYGVVLEKT